MVRQSEKAAGIAYPQLSREAINLLIDSLVWSIRDRQLGTRMDLAEDTAARLTEFYTRRWGLPPAITGRIDQLHELTAGRLSHVVGAPQVVRDRVRGAGVGVGEVEE